MHTNKKQSPLAEKILLLAADYSADYSLTKGRCPLHCHSEILPPSFFCTVSVKHAHVIDPN